MNLDHLMGMTHEELRAWQDEPAASIKYPNPNDPEFYTTMVVRWPNGTVLWQEICNRCKAIVEDRQGHDDWHRRLKL